MRGSELAVRKQQYAGSIDWVHRPAPTLENKYLRPEVLKGLKRRAAAATGGAAAGRTSTGQLRPRLRRAAKKLPAPVGEPLFRSVAAVRKATARARR